MNDQDDVYQGDMEPLTPDELDAALAEATSAADPEHVTARFLHEASQTLRSVQPPTPSPALSEFIGVSTSTDTDMVIVLPRHSAVEASAQQRKPKMFASLATAAATTGGKLLVGAAALVSVAGGAHATGVVDLVPDGDNEQTVQVATQPDGPADEVLGDFRIAAGQAGSVLLYVEDGAVVSAAVSSEDGWSAEQSEGDEDVKVVFTNEDGDEVVVMARLEGELVRVEVADATFCRVNDDDAPGVVLAQRLEQCRFTRTALSN